LFSHKSSLVLLDPTRSLMKVGHLAGQSCFRICVARMNRRSLGAPMHNPPHAERGRTSTSTPFSLVWYTPMLGGCSVLDCLITSDTTKFLTPAVDMSGGEVSCGQAH
jgi:hypothetical protein